MHWLPDNSLLAGLDLDARIEVGEKVKGIIVEEILAFRVDRQDDEAQEAASIPQGRSSGNVARR